MSQRRSEAAKKRLEGTTSEQPFSKDALVSALRDLRESEANSTKTEQSVNTTASSDKPTSKASRITLTSDVNFIRKEFVYTKLKYSRSPAYDAVSGGFAALLAGFIGFLISEKFGIELVDSGDFFIGFMYAVFGVFSVRLAVNTSSDVSSPRLFCNPRHNLLFVREISTFAVRRLISFLK